MKEEQVKVTPLFISTGTDENGDQKYLPVVILCTLPEKQRKPFIAWLFGQTVMDYHGNTAAYYWDYESWYNSWIKGEVAPVFD